MNETAEAGSTVAGPSRSLASAVRLILVTVLLFVTFCALEQMRGSALAAPWPLPRVAPRGLLPPPGSFRLATSNGYTMYVLAPPPRNGRLVALFITVSSHGRGVTYYVPAKVTETTMQADLGQLGEISLSFQPTHQATGVPCGEETIRFDSGQYEGTVDFHGEEGYTSVESSAVPGNIDFRPAGLCENNFGVGAQHERRRHGANLYVRNPGLGPELSVHKSRPGAAAEITAWVSEYSEGISIDRYVHLRMPDQDFSFDRGLRRAAVSPPEPFDGSARLDLARKPGRRWSGDLTVDMPGRLGVPLTTPTLRATLSPTL